MKLLSTISLWFGFVCGVFAQDVSVVHSRTEQFVVYGSQALFRTSQPAMQGMAVGQGNFFWFTPEYRTNEMTRVRLVPDLVAVACERIKEAVLHELGERDGGGRMIHIQLNNRRQENDISVMAARVSKGWLYRLELPVNTSPERFSDTMTSVLLTEFANRQAGQQSVDVPLWLLAGFSAHLRATSIESLVLQPNLQTLRDQKYDPSTRLRKRFQAEQPLTFEEMSWPGQLDADQAGRFSDSAQLFVGQLLGLKEGRGGVKKFLMELPRYQNWQFAFLAAFQPRFAQLLDVEKWWALQVASLAGRDFSRLYSGEESWSKMKNVLDVPAQIHLKSDRLPVAAVITLQEVIQQWEATRAELTLQKAIGQLRVLRLRVQPELVPLVDGYRKVLEKYLEQRTPQKGGAKFSRTEINPGALKKNACAQLSALDERRAKLRQELARKAGAEVTVSAAPERPDLKK